MADASSTVELIFAGIDRTAEATQSALNNASKFSKSVQDVAAPIADATLAAAKFEAAILATGVAITGFAIKTAADFDTAFREISTLIGIPSSELGAFRDEILEYASDSTQGLDAIGNALYQAISNGIAYTESIEFMRAAEKLAVAGKADLADVTIALTKTINAFGLEVDDVETVSDIFFSTVRNGSLDIAQLSNAFPKVAGPAATLGVSIEEVTAILATLTTTTAPNVDIAATQLAQAFFSIIAPSEQAKKTAAELGIEFDAAAVRSKGFEAVLQDVAEATDGNEEALKRLFGSTQAVAAILPIAGNAAERFAKNLDDARNSTGATEMAYQEMTASIKSANDTLAGQLEVLLVRIGQPLLDEYGSITKSIGAIFNALGVSVKEGQLGGLVEFIESLMADLAAALAQIAKNLPAALESADLSGFQRNIEAVVEGIKKLFSGVDLSTEKGLKEAIEGIGNLFGQLGTFVGTAVGTLKPLVEGLLVIFQVIGDLDEEWVKLGATVGGFSIIIDKVLGPALDAMLFILVAKSIGGSAGGVLGGLAGMATKAGALLPLLGQAGLVGAAGAGGYAIGTVLAGGIDAVVDRLTGSGSLGGLIYDLVNGTDDWSDSAELAARQQRALWEETKGAREAAAEIEALDRQFDRLWDVVQAGGQAYDTVEEALDNAVDTQRVFFDEATGKWLVLGQQVRDFGGNFSGIEDSYDILQKKIERLGTTVTENGKTWEFARDESGRFFQRLISGTDDANAKTGKWIETTVDGVRTFTQIGGAAGGAFDEASKAAEDATRKSEAYLLKMEEIASNERIKLIEAKVTLNVAEIEADTKRVEAAFSSITSTIAESYDMLGSLFGLLTEADRWTQLKIESQIKEENRRLDEQLELKKRLTEAQIDKIYADIRKMERGDALIQVDGAGLQPHLEAFMWEILRAIQVRVNQDGLEMLLGT